MAAVRDFWVRAALALAFLLPVYFATAALAVKFGLLDWRVGFGVMTIGVGPMIILGVLAFAVIGLLLALIVPPRRGRRIALAALAFPATALVAAALFLRAAQGVPPIHDISTDLLDPPTFSASVVAERAKIPGSNGVDLADSRAPTTPQKRFGKAEGRLVRELQAEAYPDVQPIRFAGSVESAVAAAEAAARKSGLTVGLVDAQGGRIEAYATSFWYGFVDDVVIRVRPATGAAGAVIDIRSTSRVGVSDLGANAGRIRALRAALGDAAV